MLVPTKKHRTSSELTKRVVKEEEEQNMSFDEAMKLLLKGKNQASVVLRGFRYREGLTQEALGEILGIDQTNISKMERGLRPIGKLMAKKLAEFFKTDYRIFL
jgi:DNA-binding XRE family transcriptional regulator